MTPVSTAHFDGQLTWPVKTGSVYRPHLCLYALTYVLALYNMRVGDLSSNYHCIVSTPWIHRNQWTQTRSSWGPKAVFVLKMSYWNISSNLTMIIKNLIIADGDISNQSRVHICDIKVRPPDVSVSGVKEWCFHFQVKFFHNITQSTSCLHYLLPDPKLPSHNSRLRSYEIFPRLHTRTKRYHSFVQYALSHYQDRIHSS